MSYLLREDGSFILREDGTSKFLLESTTTQAMTATLSFTGTFTKRTSHILTAVLSFTGAFIKRLSRAIQSSLGFNDLSTNGTFEVGTGTTNANFTVPGWLLTTPANATLITIDTTTQYEGQQALKILVDAGNSNNGIKSSADIPVLPNTTYLVSVWVKSDTNGQMQIQFREHVASGNYVQTDGTTWNSTATYQNITTTTSWTQFTFQFTTAAGQTTVAVSDFKRSGLSTQANRTFWVDSFTLVAPSLIKKTIRSLTASLSFVGSIIRNTTHKLTASLSFTGSLLRFISKKVTAALSFTGLLVRNGHHFISFASSLSFVGSLRKIFGKHFTATLSFVGAISGFIKPILNDLTNKIINTTETDQLLDDNSEQTVNTGDTIENINTTTTKKDLEE